MLSKFKMVAIAWESLAVFLQITLAVVSYSRMHKNVNWRLKVIWNTTLFCACAATIAAIEMDASIISGHHWTDQIPFFIFSTTWYWFFISLWSTLVLRLYHTFKDSMFRMSKCRIAMFIVIFILLISTSVTSITLTAVIITNTVDNLFVYVLIAAFNTLGFFIIFFIGAALAVTFFVCNLVKLAKSRQRPIREFQLTVKMESARCSDCDKEIVVTLDEHQQDLSDLSARYILLFTIAAISTICFMVISFAALVHSDFFFSLLVADFCVNLFCLYLQFGFAQDHYQWSCHFCDRRCRRIVSKRTKRIIRAHSIHMSTQQLSPKTPRSSMHSTPSTSNAISSTNDEGESVGEYCHRCHQ